MELKDLSANWNKLKRALDEEKHQNPGRSKKPTERQAEGQSQPRSRKRKGLDSPPPDLNGTTSGHVVKRRKTSKPPRSAHIIRKAEPPASTDRPAKPRETDRPAPGPPSQAAASAAAPPAGSRPTDALNAGLDAAVRIGRYVAMDCEMVGVGPRPAAESALARVSLVNYDGAQVYDALVATREAVTDYRTAVSGITPAMLAPGGGARPLDAVQRDVAAALHGRVLVGHAVQNDLHALFLSHPRRDTRDTSQYPPYRRMVGGRNPGLRRLAKELLGLDIQGGAHSSVEDARATMSLFRREKDGFEKEAAKHGRPKKELVGKKRSAEESQRASGIQKERKT